MITTTKKTKYFKSGEYYLNGPKSRGSEFLFLLKVLWQFLRGFRKLHFVDPCITVFGSARFGEEHPYYQQAKILGSRIAEMGFTVMTGGGPGIMEAANKGAFEAGGHSIGCNIKLPYEQLPNPYMHQWITFDHFFVRKVLLLKYSYAFIVLPGGFGTMDEMFETLTLIQTGIIHHFPIVVMGMDYYADLMKYLDFMSAEGTISPEDISLIKITDDPEQAILHVKNYLDQYYNIQKKKPVWWLFEK